MAAINSIYSSIRSLRDQEMPSVRTDLPQLNQLHDELLQQTIRLAINKVTDRLGPPPSSFSFFVMGSAGRKEQGVWSDQDHSIIYELDNSGARPYFLTVGEEISEGLHQVGYKRCDGRVMANNPFWCRSQKEWQGQLRLWIEDSSWESIRYLLTFIDGRTMYGDNLPLTLLKQYAYEQIHREGILKRLLDNTMHIKKATNVLGQLLVETHGPHTGHLNIKETALFPFVNAGRLLAIGARMQETSTIDRINELSDNILPKNYRRTFSTQFLQLHRYRLAYGNHADYDSGHFLDIEKLSKQQKKELKALIKDGYHFFDFVKQTIGKEDAKWG